MWRKRVVKWSARNQARSILLVIFLACAMPVSASEPAGQEQTPLGKFMPLPEELALPTEQELLNRTLSKLAAARDPAALLAILDAALAEVPEPTKLRGFLQFSRASLLFQDTDNAQALQAAEESVRLLPDYSAPLLIASSLYAYANQPGKGADYLLRAAALDPHAVRTLDDYEVNNLLRRLRFARQDDRANALSDRLFSIGWIGSRLGSQSTLARAAIERHLSNGDVASARALVPKLLLPAHSYSLLANNDFKAIWPDVERWGGPKLQRQWTIYLTEARARWTASKAIETAQDYSSALLAAGHYRSVIREIRPLLDRKLNPDDHDPIFVVAGIARALAHEGRWQEVDQVFVKAQEVWPLESTANAINIAANRARYLLLAGRPKDALQQMDAAIAQGRRWEVNPDALAAMHHSRACALHELRHTAEAGVSTSIALAAEFPVNGAQLHLCLGNASAARSLLLQALKDPSSRDGIIGFVQTPDEPAFPSEYGRKFSAKVDALRNDPELVETVKKYGRILPFSLTDGAPAEPR
jgi:tetratricopeptide (TPR) repeat protein